MGIALYTDSVYDIREVIAVPDYKKPYFVLFNTLSDAIAAIEKQNYGTARELLLKAQQAGEILILAQKDDETAPQ
jgi:hypothetical protein